MVQFILNPTAGKGRTLKVLDKLTDYLKVRSVEYAVHFTQRAGHATEIARKLSQAPSDLVVIGGDGTVSEVLNGIDRFENVALGIIPCGTGNDFAASANLPVMEPKDAMELILSGTPRYTDFIQIGDKRSMNVAGMGIDVDVLERYNRRKMRTKFTYMQCLVSALVALKWMNFELEVDGVPLGHREAMIASVANGKYFGGGMVISPNSQIDDGKLDLVIVNKLPKSKMLGPLLGFKKGTLLKYDFVESIPCRSVKVVSAAKKVVNVDGELWNSPVFECKIVSDLLRMYRP